MALQMPNDALLGLAIQQGTGATDYLKMAAGYEEAVSADGSFHFYPFTDLSLAPTKNSDTLPQEIGGKALPTGEFVTGVWAEGPVSLIPRMDNRLGWLLLAAMGNVSTVDDTKIEDLSLIGGSGEGTTSGIHTHIFTVVQDNQFFQPWLTSRRLLPHGTAGERVGEVFQDGRIQTFTLNAAAGAAVNCDINVLARVKQEDFVFNINPGWTSNYDSFDDFLVTSCDGHFKVADTAFKVTSMAMTLTNNLLPPAQSLHIGNINPLDFPNLGRTLTVTGTFLVEDYDLYLSIFAGSAVDASASSGENVSCTVYEAELDVMLATQTAIGAAGDADEPYRMRLISNQVDDNVSWTVQPIRIQPNRPVVAQVTGTFKASASGYPWYLMIQNAQSGYTL